MSKAGAKVNNPETDPYDRMSLRLFKDSADYLVSWADCVGYASKDVYVKETDIGFKQKKRIGVTTGRRTIRFDSTPALVAKNRDGLPPVLPFSWEAFADAFAGKYEEQEEEKQAEEPTAA